MGTLLKLCVCVCMYACLCIYNVLKTYQPLSRLTVNDERAKVKAIDTTEGLQGLYIMTTIFTSK